MSIKAAFIESCVSGGIKGAEVLTLGLLETAVRTVLKNNPKPWSISLISGIGCMASAITTSVIVESLKEDLNTCDKKSVKEIVKSVIEEKINLQKPQKKIINASLLEKTLKFGLPICIQYYLIPFFVQRLTGFQATNQRRVVEIGLSMLCNFLMFRFYHLIGLIFLKNNEENMRIQSHLEMISALLREDNGSPI